MIVIITGASHTGKTALAQELLKIYGYTYLSIDLLKMGLIRSGNTSLTPSDDLKLRDYLWPIVREIIKTAIENQQNLVVEGGYVPVDTWRDGFMENELKQIRFICLVMTNEYINEHIGQIIEFENIIEDRKKKCPRVLDKMGALKDALVLDNNYYMSWHMSKVLECDNELYIVINSKYALGDILYKVQGFLK